MARPGPPALWKALEWENLKERLRGMILDNVGFKLLAVIFALATWSWVQGEQVVQEKARVAVEWILPTNLALADEIPETLILTVSGSQMFVRNVNRQTLRLKVDLSDVDAGPQVVEFQDRSIENFPQNVHIVSLSPAKAEFRLDEKVKRRFKVTPLTVGEPSSGYRIHKVSVDPDHVEVEGPRSRLAELTELATVAVDVGGIQEDKEETVDLARVPSYLRSLNARSFHVKVSVEPLTTVKIFEDIPVVLRSKGWAVTPDRATIALEGPVADLEEVKHDQVMVMINVAEDAQRKTFRVTQGEGNARYDVVYPRSQGVRIRSVRPDTFRVHPEE